MKSNLAYKFLYHRRLPHIQPEGATFFVTSRLAGSLPVEVIEKLHCEREQIDLDLAKIVDKKQRMEKAFAEARRIFEKWDDALDSLTDVNYLSNPLVAAMLFESLQYRDGKGYELIAFTIMPNHIHVVFTPLKEREDRYYSLSKIMHSLKLYTAQQANLILGRQGTFWQHENYDHFIRGESELERIIKYVLYNPVKANLVKDQRDWKWTFCKYDF